MPFTVSIVRNIIPQVRASIEDKSEEAVRKNAENTRDQARDTAPRRTGALAASFYVSGPRGESGYPEAAGHARELNPKANIVPELQGAIIDPRLNQLRDTVTGRFTYTQAVVASAVEYSLYVEEGTVHMAPRPILRNAALQAEMLFKSMMNKVADVV